MNVSNVLHWPAKPGATDDQEHDPLAATAPDVIAIARIAVLSTDTDLWETLAGISNAVAAMHLVDDWTALLDTLVLQRCGVVILDAEGMEPGQLDSRLAELNRLRASPVVIVAARGERAKESMELLAAGKVPRLLLKPATPGAARLAIDFAIARSRQGRSMSAMPPTTAERRYGHRGALLAGFMVIAFAVTVFGGLIWRGSSDVAPVAEMPAPVTPPVVPDLAPVASELQVPPVAPAGDPEVADAQPGTEFIEEHSQQPIAVEIAEPGPIEVTAPAVNTVDAVEPAPAAPQSASTTPARPEIDRLLRRGEERLQAGELIHPQEDNALLHYGRAAAINGSDPRVADLRSRLGEAIVAAVLQALELEDIREGELLLESGSELGINAVVLGHLAAQLNAANARQQAEQRATHEAGLLQAGLDRMREQALVTPEGDSAAYYLARLRAESPDHPGLAAPWTALIATLAGNARNAIMTGEFVSAVEWIDRLRSLDAEPGLVETLSTSLASARRQREFLRVPAQPSELQLVHSETASYPRQALLRNLEGWVDVDFIVDRHGVPRDIEITAAEPAGVFERSATNAVGRYRYQPFVLDGEVYERRVALRLLFALD